MALASEKKGPTSAATTPSALATPSTQGFASKYQQQKQIATIKNGGVLVCTHVPGHTPPGWTHGEERVAVKFFDTEAYPKGTSVLRWEMMGMKMLEPHKNILRCYEVVITPGTTYMVTDLAHSDLYAATETVPDLPAVCAKAMFKQMAAGVLACHQNGIGHRDIKFENFFVTFKRGGGPKDLGDPAKLNGYTIVLGDFGFWCYSRDQAGGLVRAHEHCGSDVYGAPEQCLKELKTEKGYDPERADIFSLGVCLFMAYFGFPPWETNQAFSDAYTQLWAHGKVKSFWQIIDYHTQQLATPAFKHLFSTMCCLDPAFRPTIQEVLAHPFLTGGDAEKNFVYDPPTETANKALSAKYAAAISARENQLAVASASLSYSAADA